MSRTICCFIIEHKMLFLFIFVNNYLRVSLIFHQGAKKNLEISVFALLCNANSRFIFEIIISRDIELVILGVEFPQINVF